MQESWLQLLVTWASGVLLLAVATYLVIEGRAPVRPPNFVAEVEEVQLIGERHYLSLAVSNLGSQSVQDLAIAVELRDAGEVVESSEASLDWLPEGSTRRVVLITETDPSAFEIAVAFAGYQVP